MNEPKKIDLAQIPTPLQKISFQNKGFYIKRDDLTGAELTGNKVRKLEYLLYQAKREKSDYIFTCGGTQSNHARATAIAAAQLGFKSRLFLWGKESRNADGNLFMDKFVGAEVTFLNKKSYVKVNEIMFDERKKLLKKGKNAFVLPEGGSTVLGIWGYIKFIQELNKQIDLNKISGLVAASGSGGTAAGLLVGASLLNLNLKIFAVSVFYSPEELKKKILFLAKGNILEYGLNCELKESNLQILGGYSKEGYKNISKDKINLISKFARETGIFLDPAYTGKAFCAYYDNLLSKGKGLENIFIHTGGLFGIFAKREKYLRIT
jgi:D-cysteine desulfhydrase